MSRRVVVALGLAAGALVTATPAHADTTGDPVTPWAVNGTPAPWTTTDHSGEKPRTETTPQRPQEPRQRTNGPSRVRRAAPATARPVASQPHKRVAGHRPAARPAPRRAAERVWHVAPGDTLWAIAGVYPDLGPRLGAVERIARRNGIALPQGLIRDGQTLVIPAAQGSGAR